MLTIVMVTRCTEGSRLKCVQYWPEMAEGKTKFDGVVVTPIDETPSRGFVVSSSNSPYHNCQLLENVHGFEKTYRLMSYIYNLIR